MSVKIVYVVNEVCYEMYVERSKNIHSVTGIKTGLLKMCDITVFCVVQIPEWNLCKK